MLSEQDVQVLLDNFDTLDDKKKQLVQDFIIYKANHPLEFYKPLSQTQAFHESKKSIRALWGGNSSGKTFAGEREALIYLTLDTHPFSGIQIPQGARGRVTHYDFSMLDKEVVPRLKSLIPHSLYNDGIWEGKTYDAKAHFLKLNNGRTCDFLTYDQDPEKHESVTLHWQWADETMPEKYYDACLSRILRTGGRFWITTTPLAKMGWAVTRLYENIELQDLVDNFLADIDGNYTLNKEFVDNFSRTINPDERESRLHGRFMQLQGLVYKEMVRGIHTLKNYKLHENGFTVMSVDPHPSQNIAVAWTEILPDGTKVVFDEIWRANLTIQDLASLIKQKEKQHGKVPVLRIIDKHSITAINYTEQGMNVITEFGKYGLFFVESIDDHILGYSKVHEYLKFDNTRKVDFLNRPRLYICEDTCPQCTFQMFHFSWKDDGREEEKYKHFPDTIRYMVMGSEGMQIGDDMNWENFNNEISKIKLSQNEG